MPVRTRAGLRAVKSRAAILMKIARDRPDLFVDFECGGITDCPRRFVAVRRRARKNDENADTNVENRQGLEAEKVSQKDDDFEEILCETEFVHSKDLSDDLKKSLVDLTRTNMKAQYDAAGKHRSNWLWDDDKKLSEISHKNARHFIVYVSNTAGDSGSSNSETHARREVAGFAHIRFEVELGRETVYLYEFQVDPKYMGCGIGKYLLRLVEQSAFVMKCQDVTLTCFKNNDAFLFYKKFGFKLDPDSPDEKSCPYEILTKPVKQK